MGFIRVPIGQKEEKQGTAKITNMSRKRNDVLIIHVFHRVLASTHFEPTSARMALPCFDEPIFKANYSVRIRRGPSHISLSNMPLVRLSHKIFFN